MPVTPPISVLVVDDHEVVRTSLGALLASMPGIHLWGTSPSAEDALSLLSASDEADGPTLVLSDLNMPGMNGLELATELRSRRPGLPCLVFSAHRSSAYADKARAAGAVGFVEKGDWAALVNAIQSGSASASQRAPEGAAVP